MLKYIIIINLTRFVRNTIEPINENRTSKTSHNQVGPTQILLVGKNICSLEFYKGVGGLCCWLGVILKLFLCFGEFFDVTLPTYNRPHK